MNPPPIVAVTWEDATVLDDGPWASNTPHVYKPHLVCQVGFLLKESEECLVLTQAWHPESVAARDQIPRGMVRSITYLQPLKRKR